MQTILFGINNLKEALNGVSRLLVVCDSSYPYLNIKKDVESISVPKVFFDQFSSNPLYESVCEGVKLFNAEHCDTILAVGGGSAIDVAKCIKLYCKMPEGELFLNQPYQDSGIKLIAVPTTAGTGSESTRFAVIYYDGKKQSITHDSIIPNIAILEPKVLKTLPLYQKKCTMMDALCQGIESWWSVNSTDESKQYSKIAVETIIQNWRDYIFNNSEAAAEKIMLAANYSGQAICITQTTAPHAFSYKITSMYGLPHGHAVAICLPEIWAYMLQDPEKCADSRGNKYVQNIFYDISQSLGLINPKEALTSISSLLSELGLDKPIPGKDREGEIKLLCKSVNPVRLANNPYFISEVVIGFLYDRIVNPA